MWCEGEQMGALASAKQPPRVGPISPPWWFKEHAVLKVSRLSYRKCLNTIAWRIHAVNSVSRHTVCEAFLETLIHNSHATQGKHGASVSIDTHLTVLTFSLRPITQLLFYIYIFYSISIFYIYICGRNFFSKRPFFS